MATRRYMLGKHLIGVQVYGGVENLDGTVTWTSLGFESGTTLSLAAPKQLDFFTIEDSRMLDMISSVDDIFANYEQILYDSTFGIGEILTQASTILPGLASGYQLALMAATRRHVGTAGATVAYQTGGTGGALSLTYPANAEMYVYCGQIQGFDDGIKVQGKNTATAMLRPKNIGQANGPLALFNT